MDENQKPVLNPTTPAGPPTDSNIPGDNPKSSPQQIPPSPPGGAPQPFTPPPEPPKPPPSAPPSPGGDYGNQQGLPEEGKTEGLPEEEIGAGLPPVLTPPPEKKFPVKKIGGIIAVLLLLVSLPVGIFLVQQRQQLGVPAYNAQDCDSRGGLKEITEDCDCGRMQPDGELVQVFVCNNGDRLPGSPTGRSCLEKGIICQAPPPPGQTPACNESNCSGSGSKSGTEWKCHSDTRSEKDNIPGCYMECLPGYQWVEKDGNPFDHCEKTETGTGGSCAPTFKTSGATTPGMDCKEGGSASISVEISMPAGCGATTVNYRETNASCPGSQWAGCGGACGSPAQSKSITVSGGQTKTISTSCSPPGGCGSCQVDLDGPWGTYGVRRYQSSGCAAPPAPTPSPPTPTAECKNIKFYDESWAQITASDIKPGQSIRLAVSGTTTDPGGITQAKIIVNGKEQVTELKNSKGEFYITYTVPETGGSFNVEAFVFNPTLGWK